MATVGLLRGGASGLSGSTVDLVDGIGIADLEVFLADEGGHCLLVVLEPRFGVVGCAETLEGQSRRVAGVLVISIAAEGLAGVELSLAPLVSSSEIDG